MWQARGGICPVRLRFPENPIEGLVFGKGSGHFGNRSANRGYFFYPTGTLNLGWPLDRFRGRTVTYASGVDRAAPGTKCRLGSLVNKLRVLDSWRLSG